MSKFYDNEIANSNSISSAADSQAAQDALKDIKIELNGDVLGYGPPDEVLTSIAPSGVKPGIYGKVRVGVDGRVYEGFIDDTTTDLAPVIKTFKFPIPALVWSIKHNLNTRNFTESIRSANGQRMYANIKIVDDNEFWVELTEAEAGAITVTFDLSEEPAQVQL